jgi:hypothetical protein
VAWPPLRGTGDAAPSLQIAGLAAVTAASSSACVATGVSVVAFERALVGAGAASTAAVAAGASDVALSGATALPAARLATGTSLAPLEGVPSTVDAVLAAVVAAGAGGV